MVKLFVIGSCVTRDALESKFTTNEYKISKYYARTSLARLAYPHGHIKLEDINLESKFQRQAVFRDISKTLTSELQKEDFDFLILDMVDDRFGLIKFDNTYVTLSDEFKKSKLIDIKSSEKIIANSNQYREAWEYGLKEILKFISPEKIIINNVQWATKTDLGEVLLTPERIKFCTEVVNYLYETSLKYIPKNNFINYNNSIFLGLSNHKWGKSPFHYIDAVYEYFIEQLNLKVKK